MSSLVDELIATLTSHRTLCESLRPENGDCFYREGDQTNSVKVLKDAIVVRIRFCYHQDHFAVTVDKRKATE